MSQVDDRLGMSLDSIISSKPRVKKDTAGRKKNTEKVVRSAGRANNRHGKVQRQPKFNNPRFMQHQDATIFEQPAPVNAPLSIFDRLGKVDDKSLEPSGTKILISNLHDQITSRDIAELCGSIGETKRVDVAADNKGGVVAEVIFAQQSDALNCVTKLHGLALDQRRMVVKLASGYGAAMVTNNNVRVGLFGTTDQETPAPAVNRETTFSVTLGGQQSQRQQQRVVMGQQHQHGNRSQGRHQRGNGNVRGGGGDNRQHKPASAMDLDADLDSYMGGRGKDKEAVGGRKGRATVTAEDLDAEMDAYRSAE